MTSELTSQLEAIKKNLGLQLEDIALLKKEKIVTEFFFDNADIHDAVLGSRAFYPPFTHEGFDVAKFTDKRTLVRSLASSGWLGKIRLLPPHQTEFLGQLNLYFGIGIPKDPKGEAHNFLRDIGIEPPEMLKDQSIDKLSKPQLIEFVKREAGSAERLFKAIQSIVPWHRRLVRWESQRLLEFDSGRINYEEIVQSDYFITLKKEFDDRRRNAPINNFADAAVITILIDKVKKIKEGGAGAVPRFFVPTQLFQDVIDQSGVAPLLSYKNVLGETSSVTCDPDYFIYKASFLPRNVITAEVYSAELEDIEKYLLDLRSKVSEALDVQEKITLETLARIKVRGRSLSGIIRDLLQLSFLENVWLEYKAPRDAYRALQEVIDASREMKENTTFQEGISKAKATIEAKLQENAEEFKWISSIWMQVERATQDLRSRVHFNSAASIDFFRELGLFRFSFPEDTQRTISNLLEKILHGEEERDARVSLVSAAYRGRQDPQIELNSLIVAAAVMFAARMYQELFVLLKKIKPLPHYSLKIAQTEVLFKLGEKREKSIANIKELENEFENAIDPVTRADLAMGIASLYFDLWHACGFEATWRQHRQIMIDPSESESGRVYISKAINYAKVAFESLDKNLIKKVYALNLYLYFMIEGEGAARRQDIEKAAQMLSPYKADRGIWLYTFDDTLARYFHLLASLSKSADEWNELMEEAKMHSHEAREGTHGNEDVGYYSTLLAVVKSAGFQGSTPVE